MNKSIAHLQVLRPKDIILGCIFLNLLLSFLIVHQIIFLDL